ncbi:flavin reductase [Roseomonas sp. PWR1]|uniref:Flavin reductase n=1 Tax=Roseomonas nitratireducens TaxID=2820810 RepID=A0ABS4AYQ2_9PROT|nr:flavin reductase [Neoroseomonas nitratireducens]MBP0466510.1 flavin reductase [Neoroseomonas nitratireducens]
MPAVTRQEFRDAMARLGAAVNIVTTDGPAGLGGLTVSAVCSVTDDPPTLLVCLNRGSPQNRLFKDNGVLCVNSLAPGQEALSTRFAGRSAEADMVERFSHAHWGLLSTGSPVLDGATVSFDCRIAEVIERGTHSVVFAEVEAVRQGAASRGLIWFSRDYHPIGAG